MAVGKKVELFKIDRVFILGLAEAHLSRGRGTEPHFQQLLLVPFLLLLVIICGILLRLLQARRGPSSTRSFGRSRLL